MKNRLHCVPQPYLLLGLLLFLFQTHLLAQNPQDDFVFTYNGVDTLYVSEDDCTITLFDENNVENWLREDENGQVIPAPTRILSDMAPMNAVLTEFAFEADSSDFDRSDPISATNVDSVRVVYRVGHNGGDTGMPVTAFFDFTLHIRDTVPPIFPNFVANRSISCVNSVPPEDLVPTDNCDGTLPAVTSTDEITIPFDKCTEGEIVRSWTAMDSDGNSRTVRQTIAVLPDFINPEFNYSVNDLTEDCGDATFVGFDSWLETESNRIRANMSDNCTEKDSIVLTTNAPTTGAATCNQAVEVIFTLTDSCGNAARDTAVYMTTDMVAPEIVDMAIVDTIEISCEMPVPPAPAPVVATDNCMTTPEVVFTETTNPPRDDMNNVCGNYNYTITRMWVAEDACDNRDTAIQIVIVRDEEAPDFDRPADVTFYECDVDLNDFTLTGSGSNATDNCDPMPTITFTDDTISMECTYSYVVERSWMAQDACNNVTTKIQTITVQDTVAPTFIVPRDTMVDCRAADSLNLVGQPTMVMDNCDSEPLISFVDVFSGQGCANGDTIRRRWRAEDECGNVFFQTQLLFVRDTSAPDLVMMAQDTTIDCADSLSIDVAFNDWIARHGGADANDNCSADSTLTWMAFNTGTMNAAFLPTANCADSTGIYRTQTVDFIVEDQCGNRAMTTARFDVIDTAAPEFTDCPMDTTIFVTDVTECGAFWRIIPIPIVDDCGVRNIPVNSDIFKSFPIESDDPGNPAVPVDTVFVEFNGILPPPFFPNGNAELTIRLSNVDAEQPTEYFNIFGEQGEFIGRTNNTNIQCDTSITFIDNIEPLEFSRWAEDGRIFFTLIPNIPEGQGGELAINDICPGGTVEAKLEYEQSSPNGVEYQLSVNGEEPYNFPFPSFNPLLPVGDNEIKLFAEDCSGNRDSCVYVVTVVDTIPPFLVCNGSQTLAIDESSCTNNFTVPLPAEIFDNCEAGERYDRTLPTEDSLQFITFSRPPNIPDFVADERTYTFTGTAANAIGTVELQATIRANINGPNRFFTLVGEDGTELGRTSINGRCDTTIVSTVTVPASLFNQYAADGQVSITARPQRNFQSQRNYITPCFVPNVMEDGDIDSLSTFNLRLIYQGVNPEFMIEGATTVALTQMMPPQVTPTIPLNVGENIITYFVDDIYENRGSCSDTITVVDNIPPVALCQGTTIFINPSGTLNDTIQVSDIDAGSSDNCGIADISVTPNIFSCDLIDQDTVMVTLRVEDLSGNVSTCQAPIRIVAQKPEPTAFVSNCAASDTLYLRANPPAAPGGIVYTYDWTGPNNFISDVENPIITNVTDAAAGTYTVTITGITGCMATGLVDVNTDDIPISPAIEAPDVVCSNENLVLQTSSIPGASYEWYSGTPDNNQLLATTATPMFTVQSPPIGRLSYFVTVLQEGCTVEPSEVKEIQVVEQPEAVVSPTNVTICEGESITLQTFVTGDDITYRWTGPNGYESNLQFPPVIENATSANAGSYRLVVSRGGCDSDPAFTAVNILERPSRPQVSNNGPVCEGDELTLTTNVTNASVYTWIAPDFTERTTNVPTLTIMTTAADNGDWSVFVTRNTCDSEPATPTNVRVNPLPALVVSSDPNPACQGQDVQFNASPTLDGATYQWTGPNGFTSASQNPILRDARIEDNGTYTVTITTPAGCMGMQDIQLEVQPGVEISGITNNGSNCLDGPTNIELSAMLFPPDDGTYMYEWRGPNGNIVSTDSTAIIPNATQSNNGTYTLNVSSGTGCQSATATTVVNVTDPPAPPNSPQFNVSTMPPFCEGDLITLETNGYSGQVEYIWTTPLGTIMTETPSLTIESAAPDNTGAYSVAVRQNGCTSNRSGETNLTVTSTPIAVVDSNSPVCAGSSINLEMQVVEGTNVMYAWTGPGGFTSSVRNPIIEEATEENQGTYVGTVTVNGCESMGSSLEVEISPVPTLPVATSNGPICIDDEDATLILAVVPSSATPGAMYTWYDRDGNQLAASSQSLTLIITNFAGYGDGMFPFTVEAEIDGCISGSATPVMVQMNTIPDNTAFAGDDRNVCENEATMLSATQPTVGEGMWTLVDGASAGVNIANPNQANTTVSGLLGGNVYTFRWALSNGACTDYSTDDVTLTVDVVEKADAGMDIDTCEVTSVFLAANQSATGEGEWSQPDVQAQLGVNIIDPNDPNTEIVGLVPGNQYVFTWTLSDNQCAETMDEVLVLVASGVAFAGADFAACGTGCAELNATASPNNDGRWSSPGSDLSFVDASDPNTLVCGLKPGDNRLVWTINEGACGENSIDEVIVSYTEGPTAVDDEIIVEVGGVIDFDVDFNDNVIGDFTVAIIDGPSHGTIEEIEPGFYTFTADPAFIGIDELTYEICNIGCECSTATVTFFIGGDPTCNPPTIFTPNNDGINDTFVIPCLNDAVNFPEANLSVFNQWGDEVFRATPYKNNWGGRFDGEELPEGTYFYVLEFADGSEPRSGFVMLQR